MRMNEAGPQKKWLRPASLADEFAGAVAYPLRAMQTGRHLGWLRDIVHLPPATKDIVHVLIPVGMQKLQVMFLRQDDI